MKKLYYLARPGDGFGWGIANTNLVRELSKRCEVVIDPPGDRFDGPCFVPVADSALTPLRKVKAPRIIGYCFTEWPLTDKAERNARQYDVLFTGSSWNTDKLRKAGIKRAETLLQGIDHERFKPQPPSERKGFVVFSGGKYEFRKGQDYVIAAMRLFMKMRSDVVLIASWANQWQQSIQTMNKSWLVDATDPMKDIPQDRFINLPLVPNEQLPAVYQLAHIGLFPNRCEAGTNLVMCEFMSCARPVIATFAHGHRDVLDGPGPFHLKSVDYDPAGWFNPNVSDILTHLEHAYTHRDELLERGRQCAELTRHLTWVSCADKVFSAAFPQG